MVRQLVRAWRARGINVVVFVDDGILSAASRETLLHHAAIVKADLLAAGWVPHKDKCQWMPSRSADWLGMNYDTQDNVVRAIPSKVTDTMFLLPTLLLTQTVHVKLIAKVVGKLISMYLAYGDIIYLRSKCLQMQIAATLSWSEHVTLSEKSVQEINFRIAYLPNNIGMTLYPPAEASAITFSDASGTGVGAISFLAPNSHSISTHRTFTDDEKASSSTHRELLAIAYALDQTQQLLAGKVVHWFTDSANVTAILKKGSMVTKLLDLALHIFDITKQNQIYFNGILDSPVSEHSIRPVVSSHRPR